MHLLPTLFVCCVVAVSALVTCATTAATAADFEPLFDGKSLSGWQGDPAIWSVKDGMIVGSTDAQPIKKNSFLSTEKKYKNFVLRAKFRLRNGNSGIQVRSTQHPEHVVKGYQADIAEQRYMGILYEEGGRGILADVKPEEVEKHLKPGKLNEYEITVDGPHIVQKINGYTTVDYTEKSDVGAKEGIIALQVHVGPPMLVMFQDVEIKELP